MLRQVFVIVCVSLILSVEGGKLLFAADRPVATALNQLDSLGLELSRIDRETRLLKQQSQELQDSVTRLELAIGRQALVVAQLDSQYRILEAERQPLLRILTRAVLSDLRLGRWAVLDALLGSKSPGEFLRRRAAMTRLRETTKQRAFESAQSLRDLKEVEDQSLTETARLAEQKRTVESVLEQIVSRENSLLEARALAELQRTELVKQQRDLAKSDKLLREQFKQVAAALDTVTSFVSVPSAITSPLGNFLSLKGVLPWPASGSVASRFGKKHHRKLETVTENPGVDLKVEEGTPVHAVARGKVTAVTWLRGFGHLCIVQHEGDHHTVYAKLGEVLVKQDDVIDASTIVGYPGFDPERESYGIHFEVWSGKEKQDPLTWLAPAKKLR